MKILIWIKKEDAISGDITEHHAQCPQPGYTNFIQVEVSQDEFVQLEDKKIDKKKQIVKESLPRTAYDEPTWIDDDTAFGD